MGVLSNLVAVVRELILSSLGWFPSEMTTFTSDEKNESTPQADADFQKEMDALGARVPPGRMGNASDLASVSLGKLLR
jgi:hypothetical protein